MGELDEETADRSRVSGMRQRPGCGSTDVRYSLRGVGKEPAASGFRNGSGTVSGGGFSVSKSSVDGTHCKEPTSRVRSSFSSVAGTSSVHCEQVGRASKQTGSKTMKTLVVAQQKGGVGKTSCLVHLAFDFFERGLRVAVIDLDTQGNASFTLKEFQSGYSASQMFDKSGSHLREFFGRLEDPPTMKLIESDASLADMEKRSLSDAAAAFRENIKALEDSGFDVVLIDTAPALGVSLAAALNAADFVMSPIELEAYSIQGIKKMVATILNIRKHNPKLHFLGMVPSKVDARNPRHVRHLGELKNAYPQFIVPTGIGLRSSIADALASGIPVWKNKKTAARLAAKEVRALAEYVHDKMGFKNV